MRAFNRSACILGCGRDLFVIARSRQEISRMHRRQALQLFAGLALCPLCTRPDFAADVHWGYEGAEGPENWGNLDPASRVCGVGGQQSPIDITDTFEATLLQLKINWDKRAESIVNNGHTIQVNMGDTSVFTHDKVNYRLVQFHFHHPSEHHYAGKGFPMEVHFVHANAAGALAVIGVMLAPGRTNGTFSKIVATMPQKEGPPIPADPAINPNSFLPTSRRYYRYSGSLTTPPCSETVDWLLFMEPVQVPEGDIARFSQLFPMNARPVQKLQRRFVLRSG
jgi:carbonic anhydrase